MIFIPNGTVVERSILVHTYYNTIHIAMFAMLMHLLHAMKSL